MTLRGLVVTLGVAVLAAPLTAAPPDYVKDVRPILAANCYSCHGLKMQKSGLRVDTVAALLKGGDDGPAVVAGKSAESSLIRVVTADDVATRMPQKKPPLSAAQVATL